MDRPPGIPPGIPIIPVPIPVAQPAPIPGIQLPPGVQLPHGVRLPPGGQIPIIPLPHRRIIIDLIRENGGNIEAIRNMIDQGLFQQGNLDFVLREAIREGHVELIRFLLELPPGQRPDVNFNNGEPLIWALIRKTRIIEIARLLLNYGANIHPAGDVELRNNADDRAIDLINFLLDQGADVNTEDGLPLRNAIAFNQRETEKILLRRGAIDLRPFERQLLIASRDGDTKLACQIIYERTDIRPYIYGDALRVSPRNNSLDIIKCLHRKGIQFEPIFVNSALFFASQYGRLNIVRYLVDQLNADVRAANNKSLKIAIDNGHTDIVRFLLNQGGVIPFFRSLIHRYRRKDIRTTYLYKIIKDDNLELLKLVLEHLPPGFRVIFLKEAARLGRLGMVQYLFEQFQFQQDDELFEEAIILAIQNGQFNVIRYLGDRGIDLTFDHNKPLIEAVKMKNPEMVRYLIDHGGDITVLTPEDQHYVEYAVQMQPLGRLAFEALEPEELEQLPEPARETLERLYVPTRGTRRPPE